MGLATYRVLADASAVGSRGGNYRELVVGKGKRLEVLEFLFEGGARLPLFNRRLRCLIGRDRPAFLTKSDRPVLVDGQIQFLRLAAKSVAFSVAIFIGRADFFSLGKQDLAGVRTVAIWPGVAMD